MGNASSGPDDDNFARLLGLQNCDAGCCRNQRKRSVVINSIRGKVQQTQVNDAVDALRKAWKRELMASQLTSEDSEAAAILIAAMDDINRSETISRLSDEERVKFQLALENVLVPVENEDVSREEIFTQYRLSSTQKARITKLLDDPAETSRMMNVARLAKTRVAAAPQAAVNQQTGRRLSLKAGEDSRRGFASSMRSSFKSEAATVTPSPRTPTSKNGQNCRQSFEGSRNSLSGNEGRRNSLSVNSRSGGSRRNSLVPDGQAPPNVSQRRKSSLVGDGTPASDATKMKRRDSVDLSTFKPSADMYLEYQGQSFKDTTRLHLRSTIDQLNPQSYENPKPVYNAYHGIIHRDA